MHSYKRSVLCLHHNVMKCRIRAWRVHPHGNSWHAWSRAIHQDTKPRSKPRLEGLRLPVLAGFVALVALIYKAIHEEEHELLDGRVSHPFILTAKTLISPTCAIYTLRPAVAPPASDGLNPYSRIWQKGLWSVWLHLPGLEIDRPYSPLPPLPNEPPGTLRILVRRHEEGKVSRALDKISVGAEVGLRGPFHDQEVDEKAKNAVVVVAGTAIVRGLQTAHVLLSRGEDKSVRILWAVGKKEECSGAARKIENLPWVTRLGKSIFAGEREIPNALVKEIIRLQELYPGKLDVEYFVSADGTRLTETKILEAVRNAGTRDTGRFIVVEGPRRFRTSIVGGYVDGLLRANGFDWYECPSYI